jgi:predicted amidophosphoribosyltransferase
MPAFCIACGAALASEARFCGACGAAIAGQTIVAPAATEPAAEIARSDPDG